MKLVWQSDTWNDSFYKRELKKKFIFLLGANILLPKSIFLLLEVKLAGIETERKKPCLFYQLDDT